jgi:ABC-2 type transport system ATP-binding protein
VNRDPLNDDPPDDSSVEVRGLTKRFGRTIALDGVDMTLGRGICGLLGPNGAGKTTLLRILATVLPSDDGAVSTFGLDPTEPGGRLEIRRRLGYLPQEPGFHQQFTAFEFVDYVAILKEWTERRSRHDEVRRVLGLVGLQDAMHQRIRTLSGGMRRRVAIAQAIIGDPSLLVLDEPTAGLDPEQRLRFRELLSALAERSTVLLSTHQTDDVAALCSHVVVLLQGRTRFVGSPAALAALADGRVWVAAARDPSAEIAWTTGGGDVRHVGTPPAGATLVAPSVEDGYLTLAGRSAHAAEAS